MARRGARSWLKAALSAADDTAEVSVQKRSVQERTALRTLFSKMRHPLIVPAAVALLATTSVLAAPGAVTSTKKLLRTGRGGGSTGVRGATTSTERQPAAAQEGSEEAGSSCGDVTVGRRESLQETIESLPPGAAICVATGVHRVGQTIVPKSGQTLVSEPGAVLNGSRLLREWTRSGPFWFAGGQEQGPTVNYGGRFPALLYETAKYSDDVFFDDRVLTRVLTLDELSPGEFYFDYQQDRIYIADNPVGHKVEAAVREVIIKSTADNVTIQGLIIEKAAGRGIDATGGRNWTIENNTIRFNHTIGVSVTRDALLQNNEIVHNGQYGVTGSGPGIVVSANEIAWNNRARFYKSPGANWASGGTKFVNTVDMVLRGNYVHHNLGDGLWCDINAVGTLMESNRIESNERRGINYEISYGAVIRHNTIADNGREGIVINSSPSSEIYANELSGNAGGIFLLQQRRGGGRLGPHITQNTYVHDNSTVLEEGLVGGKDVTGAGLFTSRNNRFEDNDYVLPSFEGRFFRWMNRNVDKGGWQDLGNDETGRFSLS